MAQDAPARSSPPAKAKSAPKSRTKSATSKSSTSKSSTPAAKSATAKPATRPVAQRSLKSNGKSNGKSTAKSTGKSAKKPVVASRRWAQQQPTAQRYKEIQQALAERGYFRGDPDGTWGLESIDSLKRFQHDQSLVEDGKIGSLSLIALGLGPKRTVVDSASEKTIPEESNPEKSKQ
jgi:peptidoglycan hydrolase-like protein with peptidoglycan-binding domain